MTTVRLPATNLDVATARDLNQRVRANDIELDWSDVTAIDEASLDALLDGIELGELPDGLGVGSIPEALMPRVTERLSGAAKPPPPSKRRPPTRRASTKTAAVRPAIWSAGGSDAPPGPARATPRAAADAAPREGELRAPSPAELRDELERLMVADLLGPAGGDEEEIEESRVSDRYLVGQLAPSRLRIRVKRGEVDGLGATGEDGSEDGKDDEAILSSDTMFPSSIGLSFCIRADARVRIEATWGRYRRKQAAERGEDERPRYVWKREPMGGTTTVTFAAGDVGPFPLDPRQPQVLVRGRARPRGAGALFVSLFLVNGQDEPEEKRDEGWLFQPFLQVTCLDDAAILGRNATVEVGAGRDPEDRALAMSYRDRLELAAGHGTAASWETPPDDPCRARVVRTSVIPSSDVAAISARRPPVAGKPPSADVDPRLEGLILDMKELAGLAQDALGPALRPIVEAYGAWIEAQRARLTEPAARLAGFEREAKTALADAALARQRILDGIELVTTDEAAFRAFRFANRAMWMQRTRTLLAERHARGDFAVFDDVDLPENRSWRTFQLAFVLLNLPGLTRLEHEERSASDDSAADLLWFPTGGGKTEAYLGAAAYTMAMRRLQGTIAGRSGEHGVAVLMRYTLRLLTLQQFQRATALLCAMEAIRREALVEGDVRWGQEPFRIGLWVGGRSTPNKTAQAEEALRMEKKTDAGPKGAVGGIGSPLQLKTCPWCGHAITANDLVVESVGKGRGRTLVYCGDRRGTCLFSPKQSPGEGLPVLVVDEEIYRKLPALLIATVDKFAQMPWKGPVGMLFGQVNGQCDRHGFRSPDLEDADSHPKKDAFPPARTRAHGLLRPPDLIIQDELHLISGPLGTLTGLYETAVDELCTWTVDGRKVRPKVIASTATVRRAREQIQALFLRGVRVFPPPGIDAGNNFFSIERTPEDVPGRRYLGICAPGRRLKVALIRTYTAALASAQKLFEKYGSHADPWMTLVGYFGSLRELGGMRRLVDDDVATRLPRMESRGLGRRRVGQAGVKELTSRLGSTEIPSLLEQLKVRFEPPPPPGGERRRVSPIDVLLATNMISVGVDVPRLGLMVVCGQPKTTSEYIQATSRVGREKPGLVLTVYNWARPRDMSHYETFEHYHRTFYQHVEGNSVTPFSPRALDRGLAGVLVSLIRQADLELNSNGRAQTIDENLPAVQRALEALGRRSELVEGDTEARKTVLANAQALLHEWRKRATNRQGGAKLGYSDVRDGETVGLLRHAGREDWGSFSCLDSLRDVEPGVALVLDDGAMDAPHPAGGRS